MDCSTDFWRFFFPPTGLLRVAVGVEASLRLAIELVVARMGEKEPVAEKGLATVSTVLPLLDQAVEKLASLIGSVPAVKDGECVALRHENGDGDGVDRKSILS